MVSSSSGSLSHSLIPTNQNPLSHSIFGTGNQAFVDQENEQQKNTNEEKTPLTYPVSIIEQGNQLTQSLTVQSNRDVESINQQHHTNAIKVDQLIDSKSETTPSVATYQKNPEQSNINPEDLTFGKWLGESLQQLPECMEKTQFKFEIQENLNRVQWHIYKCRVYGSMSTRYPPQSPPILHPFI